MKVSYHSIRQHSIRIDHQRIKPTTSRCYRRAKTSACKTSSSMPMYNHNDGKDYFLPFSCPTLHLVQLTATTQETLSVLRSTHPPSSQIPSPSFPKRIPCPTATVHYPWIAAAAHMYTRTPSRHTTTKTSHRGGVV